MSNVKNTAKRARRSQLAMESGFRLFSERGIEQVTMPDIAQDSGVARPSLYRYFSNKTELVIAIGTWKWNEYIQARNAMVTPEEAEKKTAAEALRMYTDSFLDLYRNHKDILCFNYYFNSFIQQAGATDEQKNPYLEIVQKLECAFHAEYEKGRRDGTIRMDIPEKVMFSSMFHIMLSAVTRYAVGLVYTSQDPEQELNLLADALMKEFTQNDRDDAHAIA